MKKLITFFFTINLLLICFTSFADDQSNWRHVQFTSRQNAEVNLDYTIFRYGYYGSVIVHVPELWIHVNQNGLKPEDQVRVGVRSLLKQSCS